MKDFNSWHLKLVYTVIIPYSNDSNRKGRSRTDGWSFWTDALSVLRSGRGRSATEFHVVARCQYSGHLHSPIQPQSWWNCEIHRVESIWIQSMGVPSHHLFILFIRPFLYWNPRWLWDPTQLKLMGFPLKAFLKPSSGVTTSTGQACSVSDLFHIIQKHINIILWYKLCICHLTINSSPQ